MGNTEEESKTWGQCSGINDCRKEKAVMSGVTLYKCKLMPSVTAAMKRPSSSMKWNKTDELEPRNILCSASQHRRTVNLSQREKHGVRS